MIERKGSSITARLSDEEIALVALRANFSIRFITDPKNHINNPDRLREMKAIHILAQRLAVYGEPFHFIYDKAAKSYLVSTHNGLAVGETQVSEDEVMRHISLFARKSERKNVLREMLFGSEFILEAGKEVFVSR